MTVKKNALLNQNNYSEHFITRGTKTIRGIWSYECVAGILIYKLE